VTWPRSRHLLLKPQVTPAAGSPMTRSGGWWEALRRAISGSRLLQPLRRWAGSRRPAPTVDPVRVEMRRLRLLVDEFARNHMTVVYVLRCGKRGRWRIAPGVTEALALDVGPSEGNPAVRLVANFRPRARPSEQIPDVHTFLGGVLPGSALVRATGESVDGIPGFSAVAGIRSREWIAAWSRAATRRSATFFRHAAGARDSSR